MILRRIFLAFLAIGLGLGSFAQLRSDRKLMWKSSDIVSKERIQNDPIASKSEKMPEQDQILSVEPFQGAFLDPQRGDLPFYHERMPLTGNVSRIAVSIANAQFEPLTAKEIALWPALDSIGIEPTVTAMVGVHKKIPQALIDIVPFRRDPTNGQLQKLVAFQLEVVPTKGGGQVIPKAYPANSKLASGDWFKFSVAADGVHKITYDFLQSMGLGSTDVASDQINIYGGHLGLLPFKNDVYRPTDLPLNAIQMVDGGDGVFGQGDYILFYASGPQRWDLVNDRFVHTKHVYSDSAHYFVGIGTDMPQRIDPAFLSSDASTQTVTSFNDRHFIERDLVNMIKSGRTWYGELFDLVLNYNFSFPTPFLTPGEDAVLVFNGIARTLGTSSSSSFNVSSGSALNADFPVVGISNSSINAQARPFSEEFTFQPTGGSVPLSITFTKNDPITSKGWVNYLELNCRRDLRMIGDQLSFRDVRSVGMGNVAEMVIDQAQSVYRIWEITDPTAVRNVNFDDNGNQKQFRISTDSLRQFIAFRDGGYLTPVKVGRVPAQNLHATSLPTDLVIVCPAPFLSHAMRLADARANEGLSVVVVTPEQVYNEFSSGTRDAAAIKRYMRLLYDNAGSDPALLPRYLLLFGDGSYNTVSTNYVNQNWIPSYQTVESLDLSRSYTSDDYFGLLDENEGEQSSDLVDIGIGRFCVSSVQQASEVVNKVLNYDRLRLLTTTGAVCSDASDGGIADWRTHVLFASDDQDGDNNEGHIHMYQSNFLAAKIENGYPKFNVDKVYLDAYQQVSTPGGQRYPQGAADLKDKVQKGLLIVNYVGHGGEVGWAHERFLDNATIQGWSNKDRLPLFMTATCEFSRWDDPARTSAGELVLLNPNGGGIALMTTTRLAYSNDNFLLGQKFYDHVLEPVDPLGREQRFGDIFEQTKREITAAVSGSVNHRNFSLLGDPSQRLAMPRGDVRITNITDTLGNPVDTMKALSTVRISGFVDNGSGQPLADFNGVVMPTVYDKEQLQLTLVNDPTPQSTPFQFNIRKNVIYRGKATVTNGTFNFTFVVPKDINYQIGPGRVSCYAESYNYNASGYTNDPMVGGTATDVALDEKGPKIDLYLNDDQFVHGGLTDESPMLYAKLFDENGINTVGNSIGHDLVATLDVNTEQAVVLNDLYEADLDAYKSGVVRYRYEDLAEGSHTLTLKAWDVFNNSSESTTEFVVAQSSELALAHVLNYPNPFTTHTEFYFEHNRACTSLDVQVQVFTVSGRLVKTISRKVACEGFRGDPMAWDGRDDMGDKIGRGVYVYRLSVTTPEGETADKFEKLVILR